MNNRLQTRVGLILVALLSVVLIPVPPVSAVKPVEYEKKQDNQASTWVEEGIKAAAGKTDNQKYAEMYTGKDLYTRPDPSASGGIRGCIVRPGEAIQWIMAIPPDDASLVYKGVVSGTKSNEFAFQGLPASKYDIIVVLNSSVYEGLNLMRGASTLTSPDKTSIQTAIAKAEKFYTKKVTHRLEGQTGKMTGTARAFCTFLREKESVDNRYIFYSDWRRHFMLVTLNDVGPGWQIVANRDLGGTFVKPDKGTIPVIYRKYLGSIRVTDSVVDLGDMDLSKVQK